MNNLRPLSCSYSPTSLFLLCGALLLSGCGSGGSNSSSQTVTSDNTAPLTDEPNNNSPITVADTDWPLIHQNNATTKSSPFAGPINSNVATDKWSLSDSTVLFLIGDNYLYHQAATGGVISAFMPDDLSRGPVYQADPGADFRTGGGIIDSNNRLWWTSDDRLIRVEEDLSGMVYSEPMRPSIEDELNGAEFPYLNGTTLLPDSNILVTSVGHFAWVLNTHQDDAGEFSIVTPINWQNLTLNGHAFLENETRFSPRPIIDQNGDIVIVSPDYMIKLHYNSATQNIEHEALWVFANPENASGDTVSSLGISHAVHINDLICVATAPLNPAAVQQIYCVDDANGQLVYHLEPFSTAFGARALHTLGGLSEENWLVTIANASDGSAGMRAYDLNTGLAISDSVPLNDISEAFAISAANRHAYISHKTAPEQMAVSAVNLQTGVATEIYSTGLTDARSIAVGLAPSLSAIGEHGLYLPLPDGIIRLSDTGPVWQGNSSLGQEDWREQWGLAAWNAQQQILTRGVWGEDDLEIVADPYDPEHRVLRVHYDADSVTIDSGVGMLLLPDLALKDPKKACLSYKQLFDNDFDLGTTGGKLPGLYGFAESSGVTLDATVCAGPYAYDSDTCFSARLGYRNLHSQGYPDTQMFYEVIPWMDETECRDTWICDLPYGEGMTMRTANPESFMARKGEWTQIEQEIQLNDAGQSNGYIKVWYQGELVVESLAARNLAR